MRNSGEKFYVRLVAGERIETPGFCEDAAMRLMVIRLRERKQALDCEIEKLECMRGEVVAAIGATIRCLEKNPSEGE